MAGLAALERHPEAVAYACSFDAGAFAHRVKDKISADLVSGTFAAANCGSRPVGGMKIALYGLHSSSTIVRRSAFRRRVVSTIVIGAYGVKTATSGSDPVHGTRLLGSNSRIRFHVEDSASSVSP